MFLSYFLYTWGIISMIPPIMNSNELQKWFPEVYRDFFSKNDLVVSGCFSFAWGSGIWERSNNILVKSKVPLKTFVGIKKSQKSWIIYKDINIFDTIRYDFSPYRLEKLGINEVGITSLIWEFLWENNYNWWIEISGISEVSRGHSFWFAGTFFATLVTWLFIIIWKVNIEDITLDYDKFIQSQEFKNIFTLAWKMELIAKYGNSIWQNVMHSLQNSPNPSYFFAENFEQDKDLWCHFTKYVDIIKRHDAKIISSTIPLDYMVIFSWIPTNIQMAEIVNKARWNKAWDYSAFIHREILWEEGISKGIYLKKFAHNNGALIHEAYDDIIALSWIKTIDLFIQMFSNWYDEHTIDDFIDNINRYRHMVGLIEKPSSFAEDLIFHFHKNQKNSNEKFSILPICSGKIGGGYLVVMKSMISRDTISCAIWEMKKNYPNAEIEYSSYEDGNCNDGIVIEQFVSKWIFSPYVQANQVIFKKNNWTSYLEKHGTILEKETTWLVIDTINSKLYLNGTRLTSKEIPSQNATAGILNILFEHLWEDISNKELPSSSYSTNKNEMLGKIVIPLIKLLEEQLWEKLPLICKGEISDFYLKLNNTTISIGIIQKI